MAARQGLIGAAGVFTIIAGALFGSGWLSLHRDYWRGQWECSAQLEASAITRYTITLVAVAAALVATTAMLQIARSKSPRHRTLAAYWLSSITLWIALASMILASGVERTMCARGLFL